MKSLRRFVTAAASIVLLTMGSISPATAAPQIDFNPRPVFPGWNPIDISLPPEPVGDLRCTNGILIGNFTDADQDDSTLHVYATLNDGRRLDDDRRVEYPTLRWSGEFMWVPPFRNIQMNLTAVDDDGNRTHHRAVEMRPDGSCVLYP